MIKKNSFIAFLESVPTFMEMGFVINNLICMQSVSPSSFTAAFDIIDDNTGILWTTQSVSLIVLKFCFVHILTG